MFIVGDAARAIDVVVIVIEASSPRKCSHLLCALRAQLSLCNGSAQVANPLRVGIGPVCALPWVHAFPHGRLLDFAKRGQQPVAHVPLRKKQSFGCTDRKPDKIAWQPSTPDDPRESLDPPTVAVSSSHTHVVLVGEALHQWQED